MTTWTPAELAGLDRASEVRIAGRRADGSSRTLTIVWHVVVDGNLYLRSVKGPEGQWYRGVTHHFEGFLHDAGTTRPVAFTLDHTPTTPRSTTPTSPSTAEARPPAPSPARSHGRPRCASTPDDPRKDDPSANTGRTIVSHRVGEEDRWAWSSPTSRVASTAKSSTQTLSSRSWRRRHDVPGCSRDRVLGIRSARTPNTK